MSTFLVTCPDCGRVRVDQNDVRLMVVRGAGSDASPESTYLFQCPDCGERIDVPADDRIVHHLVAAGVKVTVLEGMHPALRGRRSKKTAEPHPEEPAPGSPLDYDDLLDFHYLLARDDWFELLAQASTT